MIIRQKNINKLNDKDRKKLQLLINFIDNHVSKFVNDCIMECSRDKEFTKKQIKSASEELNELEKNGIIDNQGKIDEKLLNNLPQKDKRMIFYSIVRGTILANIAIMTYSEKVTADIEMSELEHISRISILKAKVIIKENAEYNNFWGRMTDCIYPKIDKDLFKKANLTIPEALQNLQDIKIKAQPTVIFEDHTPPSTGLRNNTPPTGLRSDRLNDAEIKRSDKSLGL